MHLLHELGSQVVQRDVRQILQLVFLGERPDHGAAVALFEEALEQAPDSVLLVDGLTEAFLGLEGLLQVVFRGDRFGVCIDELQGEVTNDPHERREILGVLFRIRVFIGPSCLDLDVLCQVDNEREVVQLGLIDGLLAVIDEVGGQKNGQRKDSNIVICFFICGAKSLSIKNKHLNRVPIWCETIHGLTPDPNTLKQEK